MPLPEVLRRPRTWLIAVPVLLVLAVVVGPFVYINFIREDAPDRLELSDEAPTTTTAAGDRGAAGPTAAADEAVDSTWTVAGDSTAGYRVGEVLFGQDTEAVGRTEEVTGELTVAGPSITAATFTVDMATVESDDDRRDGQFRGRIMDVAQHPEATFALTEPIDFDALPPVGREVTVAATGDLTLRGVTRPVTFDLSARRGDVSIEVAGAIPVTFGDFDIPDASFGPAQVEDHGEIEFLLTFSPA